MSALPHLSALQAAVLAASAAVVLGLLGPSEPGGGLLHRQSQPCAGALPVAHAHNDQQHGRPLEHAVQHGFTSAEADVWLIDGRLRIGHTWREASTSRDTLDRRYLRPLLSPGGSSIGQRLPDQFTLLVDVKTDPALTVPAVTRAISRHHLTTARDTHDRGRVISFVLTSHLPGLAAAAAEQSQWRVDHRLPGDPPADRQGPPRVGDWVSGRWGNHFAWKGVGPMPTNELRRLVRLTDAAHQRGAQIRFWETPSFPGARENVWSHLLAAGVDKISTDHLAALERFLRTQGACAKS